MDSVLANFLLSHSTELLQMLLSKRCHGGWLKSIKELNLTDLVDFCGDVCVHETIPVRALMSHP